MLLPAHALKALPQQCEVCRCWADAALCAHCVARYSAPRPRCARCGIGLGSAAACCGTCLHEAPPYSHTVCVADYVFPWDTLIADFKFHARAELAGLLATRLVAAVRAAALPLPSLVLPVPLSPRRLAERGYNQAWELARRVAAELHLAADASLLQRPLETAHQAALGRGDRQRNLHQAFMVDPRRRAPLQGAQVALVDDVMTTGATAREATAVLRRAGAAEVAIWVLARTPDKD